MTRDRLDRRPPEASAPVDIGAAWRAEIARRLEALDRGEPQLFRWAEVDARIRRHTREG